jgi:hypothetical protein
MAKRKRVDFSGLSWQERMLTALQAITGFKEGGLPGIPAVTRDEDAGFRRITARSDKELSPSSWQKQLSVANFLWLQNPMAYRILELTTDFVIGDGFYFTAEDPEVSKVLARHWDHQDNAWDFKQHERFLELTLFGVLCMRPFINEHNGLVRLSPMDPGWIDELLPDKDICGKVSKIKLKERMGKNSETLKVVELDDRQYVNDERGMQVPNEYAGHLSGDIFYFSINKLSFTHYGTSELFRQADWLDAFDQFVFSLLERIFFLNAHLYDITLKGAGADAVTQKVQELEASPPRPGGFRVHTDDEEWQALAPEMRAAEVEEIARVIKTLILGSSGIPLHWFSDPEGSNRATSENSHGPVFRKFKRKQSVFAGVIRMILQYQLDKSVESGYLTENKSDGSKRDMSFEIVVPDISGKEVTQFITGLSQLVDTLATAIAESFIDRPDGARVFVSHLQELGVEVNLPDQWKVKQNEKQEKEREEKQEQEGAEDLYRELESRFGKRKKWGDRAVSAPSGKKS